jgi:hypothetical protein
MEPNTASRVPAGVRSTALGLAVDTVTPEVVTAMRDEGVRPLLLKGTVDRYMATGRRCSTGRTETPI